MTREIKIGLSVIFALLVVFGGVLVYKLRGPAAEPAVSNLEKADDDEHQEKSLLASGPGSPTVLPANEKPERTPRDDSNPADGGPRFSKDRYSGYGGPTQAATATTENDDQHRPLFLPKAPSDAGEAGDTGEAEDAGLAGNERYPAKGRYPREPLAADENAPAEATGHAATADDQQPSEIADDVPNAIVDPFSRPLTQAPEAESASARARLLPADNVHLTPSPSPSADGVGKPGEISRTAGPGDPPPKQFAGPEQLGSGGARGAAHGADRCSPPSTLTPATDDYGRAAQGGAGSRHPADEPPDAHMPYRDRIAQSPDARMQPRGSTVPPDATGSERPWQQGEIYTVEPNDSYWTISEKVYGTGGYFKAIQRHNQSKTGRTAGLNVGQSLSVPTAEVLAQKYPDLCPKPRQRPTDRGQMMTAAAGERDRLAGGGRVYVVEKGDNLFDIARYELGKPSRWNEIYELNRDQLGQDFDHLSPGMKLILPDGGQSETITSKRHNPYK